MNHKLELEMVVGSVFKDIKKNTMPPFSDIIMEFLADLSGNLLKFPKLRNFPDIVSFAYWCRKSNLIRLKQDFNFTHKRLGRGIALHIAPSNVPINYAFSLVFGLLAGNINIVRVSKTERPQIKIICDIINYLLKMEKYNKIKPMVKVLSYPRNSEITKELSLYADARMVWGGDNTIRNIRSMPTKPRCVDICFADRYSLCILNADKIINANINIFQNLLTSFFNDTFLFDQNACSSPHLIIWQGKDNNIDLAKKRFWTGMEHFVYEKSSIAPIHSIDKFIHACRLAIKLDTNTATLGYKNQVTRVQLRDVPAMIDDFRGRHGFFVETTDNKLQNLVKIINSKYQTITYFGLNPEAIRECVISNGLSGVDRIVPVGEALNIDTIWDGYNLLETLSRIIAIK